MGPIKSSGVQLKAMLKKTGRSLKQFEGAEKLDVLHAITDQIKDKVRLGRRMQLTLPELNAFLRVEGLAGGEDAKGTIQLLLELRQIQLARLADYVACANTTKDSYRDGDVDFSLALVEIPACKVSDCFSSATHDHPTAGGGDAPLEAGSTNSLGTSSEPDAGIQNDRSISDVVNATRECEDDVPAIRSSAKDLKTMLEMTGHSLKGLVGAEKLDILNMITDQIKKTVHLRHKMKLSLAALNAFIELEGLTPGGDAKCAIESLLKLRQQQLARLGRYTTATKSGQELHPGNDDASFTLALMAIPTEAVHDCFSNALMTISTEPTHDCLSVHTLPTSAHCTLGKDAAHTVNAQVVTSKRARECINDTNTSLEHSSRPTSVQRLGSLPSCSDGVVKEMIPFQRLARDMGSNDMRGGPIEAELSPGLRLLLAEQDVSHECTFETVHALLDSFEAVQALEGVALGSERHQDLDQESCHFSLHQAEAAREVDRILTTEKVQDILGPGTSDEQRQQFQRIAGLLHPEKRYIDASDARANMALRLALVARKRAGEDIKLLELIDSTRQSLGSNTYSREGEMSMANTA